MRSPSNVICVVINFLTALHSTDTRRVIWRKQNQAQLLVWLFNNNSIAPSNLNFCLLSSAVCKSSTPNCDACKDFCFYVDTFFSSLKETQYFWELYLKLAHMDTFSASWNLDMKTPVDDFIPDILSFNVAIYISENPPEKSGDTFPVSMQMAGSYVSSMLLPSSQPVFPPI